MLFQIKFIFTKNDFQWTKNYSENLVVPKFLLVNATNSLFFPVCNYKEVSCSVIFQTTEVLWSCKSSSGTLFSQLSHFPHILFVFRTDYWAQSFSDSLQVLVLVWKILWFSHLLRVPLHIQSQTLMLPFSCVSWICWCISKCFPSDDKW